MRTFMLLLLSLELERRLKRSPADNAYCKAVTADNAYCKVVDMNVYNRQCCKTIYLIETRHVEVNVLYKVIKHTFFYVDSIS